MARAFTRNAFLRGAIASGLAAAAALASDGAVASRLFIDAHLHPARRRRDRDPDALRRLLGAYGVEHATLAPPPTLFDSPERDSLDDLKAMARGDRRLSFVAGGESLNPVLQATPAGCANAEVVKRFVSQAETIARGGAAGFGELAVEHFSANRGAHPYESSPADHPLLLALADVAAGAGLPLEIHMEAVPEDMPFPPIPIRGGRNPDRLHANIPAFETLLSHNREARIVWLHAGWDLTGLRTPDLMRRLLATHPNLAMTVKIDAQPRPTAPLAPDGRIKAGWLDMLRTYPDRFMIGSDQFAGDDPERLTAARAFVDALPDDLASQITRQNALRLYRLPAAAEGASRCARRPGHAGRVDFEGGAA